MSKCYAPVVPTRIEAIQYDGTFRTLMQIAAWNTISIDKWPECAAYLVLRAEEEGQEYPQRIGLHDYVCRDVGTGRVFLHNKSSFERKYAEVVADAA